MCSADGLAHAQSAERNGRAVISSAFNGVNEEEKETACDVAMARGTFRYRKRLILKWSVRGNTRNLKVSTGQISSGLRDRKTESANCPVSVRFYTDNIVTKVLQQ